MAWTADAEQLGRFFIAEIVVSEMVGFLNRSFMAQFANPAAPFVNLSAKPPPLLRAQVFRSVILPFFPTRRTGGRSQLKTGIIKVSHEETSVVSLWSGTARMSQASGPCRLYKIFHNYRCSLTGVVKLNVLRTVSVPVCD